MKKFISYTTLLTVVLYSMAPLVSFAQSDVKEFKEYYGRPSYWRPYDQRGINVFETSKQADSMLFEGPRVRFGAGFTQQ